TVIAVLSRPGDDEFQSETQIIDVRGEHGVVSVFLGNLPVGDGYSLALNAGNCIGSAGFAIEANATTLVQATLTCGGAASQPTGNEQPTVSIDAEAPNGEGKPCSEAGRAHMECRERP